MEPSSVARAMLPETSIALSAAIRLKTSSPRPENQTEIRTDTDRRAECWGLSARLRRGSSFPCRTARRTRCHPANAVIPSGFRRAAPQYRDAGWFGDLRPRRYRATESREASRCQCGSSDNGVSLASCARVQALPGKPPRAPRHLNGGLARSRKDRLWPACICPACRRSRMASKGQPAPESQRGTRLGARRFSRVSRARDGTFGAQDGRASINFSALYQLIKA